jgi:hypothetical protein
MENHNFWSPDCTFQWCFYGGNYIGTSWGLPTELARPDGVVTFTRFHKASTRYYALFRLLIKSLSCPKSIGSIGGSTIFQGQQYSSCWKAGGCRAAQLLGGFHRDLLIVSWVAPTPGCTANIPGNWYSQPLILRPFGRSGRELSVEYQVEPLSINFSLSTAKTGYRKKPGSGNLEESLFKATISQRQYQYQNHTKIT